MGIVSATIFTSPSRLPLYFLTHNKPKLCGTTQEIQLLLDQRLKAKHVKEPLIAYTMVDMNESDQGRIDGDCPKFHDEYINIWECRYDFILIREPVIAWELAIAPEYMPCFRHHGKPISTIGGEQPYSAILEAFKLGRHDKKRRTKEERRPPVDHQNVAVAATDTVVSCGAIIGAIPSRHREPVQSGPVIAQLVWSTN
ncbi:hypothetical protein Gotur_028307 [Gossypium turneri]